MRGRVAIQIEAAFYAGRGARDFDGAAVAAIWSTAQSNMRRVLGMNGAIEDQAARMHGAGLFGSRRLCAKGRGRRQHRGQHSNTGTGIPNRPAAVL
jgi:hypothetical protein